MTDRFDGQARESLEVDMEIHGMLRTFDPALHDPGYWTRFGNTVLASAARELGRRRRLVPMTVTEVLMGWGRTLVPTALVAAALAGLVLVNGGNGTEPAPLGIEEMLVSELEGLTILQLSLPNAPENPLALMAEMF
jgi:hypothetical protein